MSSFVPSREHHDAQVLASRFGPLLAEAKRHAATLMHGVHGRRKSGTGETFWQFRHARTEDAYAAIDWRRSARSDDLFVRETEWEAAQGVWLWRDGRAGMAWHAHAGLPDKKDRASVLLTALAIALIKGGERVGCVGEMPRPVSGSGALDRLAISLIDGPGRAEDFQAWGPIGRPKLVIASDFYEGPDVWAARLYPIRDKGIDAVLLKIHDPAEAQFPYKGRTLFCAPDDSEGAVLFGRAQSVAADYQRVFAEFNVAMEDMARALGWPLIRHDTAKAPAPALLALHRAIGGGGR